MKSARNYSSFNDVPDIDAGEIKKKGVDIMQKVKRSDTCLFCNRRRCYLRIVRTEAPKYDEIACPLHVLDLEKHSNEVLGVRNGVFRHHISGNLSMCRGDKIERD